MISATGNSPAVRRRGFTLIEIVMVLALVALMATAVLTNFTALADRGDERTTEEILGAAIRKARFLAAQNRSVSELRYDRESGSLNIDGEGIEAIAFELSETFGDDGPGEIRFYLVPAARGLEPLGDPGRSDLEADAVRFAPDRSASPYLVEIDYGSGTPERIVYDPFSGLRRAGKE